MKGWISIITAAVLSIALIAVNLFVVFQEQPPVEEVKAAEISKINPVPESEPEPEPEVKDEPNWHFYNLDLQDDGDAENDFNFGPKVEAEDTEASMADAELRFRMRLDPALGAADMAWFDSIMGTRYLGVFYDECEHEWDAAMNQAKQVWMEKPEDYDKTLTAFFSYLDKAKKVEVKSQKGLTDQMYMNPATVDGVPDIIVMKTEDHAGKFLVYTFTIKNTTTREVAYRLDCGFQPTNVSRIMNIKPKKKSDVTGGGSSTTVNGGGGKSSTISGGGAKPQPTPTPPTPTPTPEPTPEPTPTPPTPDPDPQKDPTKGTPVLPNDDPGPGPNTNNPEDPNRSTEEKPDNSNHMTPGDYDKKIQDLKDTNDGPTSQPGDAPNTPTYTPPATTNPETGQQEQPKQDNNGDTGNPDTGSKPISDPTPVVPPSEPIKDDQPGESWDGPLDAKIVRFLEGYIGKTVVGLFNQRV